jgi:hypothetical protein
MGELVKDPFAWFCYATVLSSPGPAVPERDGWPGPGTPNSRGCIYITPLQGSAVNECHTEAERPSVVAFLDLYGPGDSR